ncbi:MAG: leucine-rich repeat domain-containing protein, partial [Promethearchaeota archaeon]
ENNYDTRLLHSNLAFPLLRQLTEAGDPQAKRVFKEEIAKRLVSNYNPVVDYLKEEDYLKYLSHEDLILSLLETEEAEAILSIERSIKKEFDILFNLNEVTTSPYILIKHRHVNTISLRKSKLSEVPSDLVYFVHLVELNLTNNLISKLPEWIIDLKNLRYFYFPENKIKFLPEWIGKLKNLRELDISYNPIEKLPDSIQNLKKIKILEIEACPIKSFPNLSTKEKLPNGLKE